ncbi:hypothetical protein BO70DRAFT_224275 [Aspergillus heteromorphus CBS 117.55]|uniref:Uncharacterized protein n=1 Tax=Aspergillus heteromorphus CBS 117.55 TaxID=1448321 RepID=A0A317WLQ8_9EURO|nr:uncharacterized protein BO70DRAFT_224275 [Aspergillus heteromorphus CBS 117.55]PWY86252.1 hypothetical protein BO70DRAFT_224275 [Aspergillus heteromorphus CBS 117.55]
MQHEPGFFFLFFLLACLLTCFRSWSLVLALVLGPWPLSLSPLHLFYLPLFHPNGLVPGNWQHGLRPFPRKCSSPWACLPGPGRDLTVTISESESESLSMSVFRVPCSVSVCVSTQPLHLSGSDSRLKIVKILVS